MIKSAGSGDETRKLTGAVKRRLGMVESFGLVNPGHFASFLDVWCSRYCRSTLYSGSELSTCLTTTYLSLCLSGFIARPVAPADQLPSGRSNHTSIVYSVIRVQEARGDRFISGTMDGSRCGRGGGGGGAY
jgi:hypothetical protein